MTIATRTPEGLPDRCPICGLEFRLEPSSPAGDAPCPACGHLLWWFRERYATPEMQARDDAPVKVTPDTRLHDLEADSVDVVELVMELEEVFGVSIPDEEYETIQTVGDAMRLVRRLRTLRIQPGDETTITSGLFESFDAIVVAVDRDTGLATIEILVFGRATRLEVPLIQLEAKGHPPRHA